ncbi:MAG: hydroxymethylglutaryl-CoA lyase [Phycisphaerales bacterium]|jgi:hydroxymethylglutaryl-CoA lyase
MTTDRPKVRITEVGPRDGLQNESVRIPTATKIQFVDQLSAAGFPEIEVTSFVSAKWVPQLGDASEVMRGITRRTGTIYSALVPNERGLEDALEACVDKVSVFVSATEGFSTRNTNGSVDEVLARIAPVVSRAKATGKPVRGYVSCIIRCPYDGPVDPAQVVAVCARLLEMGVDEIDLGDTIGVADADSISRLYQAIARIIEPSKTTLHLHDTHGQAITCALRALEIGVRSFDSSVAGLGGCPYAPGSAGNVATETLARAMVSAGFDTNIDIQRVSDAGLWMRQQLALSRAASS